MTGEELLAKLKTQALEHGANLDLSDAQEEELRQLAHQVASVAQGDERSAAHLRARLASEAFSLQAQGWLAAREWRDAVLDTLADVAAVVAVEAGKALLEGLGRSLAGSLEDQSPW